MAGEPEKRRRRRGPWRRWLPLAVLAGLGLSGLLWLQRQEAALLDDPPRRSSQLLLPERESRVALKLRLPLDLLRQAAERNLPAELRQASEPGAETVYDITLRRLGPVALQSTGEGLRATARLGVGGTAGLGGGLAALLALDANRIDAEAELQLDLKLTLDEGWCPVWSVTSRYRWLRSPRLEIIGGVWIDVEERLRARVDEALAGLPAQLANLLPCAALREQAFALWQPRSVALQLPAAPPLHLLLKPQAIGLSEISFEPDTLSVMLALRASTAISSTPPPAAEPGFLPPLRALPERWSERDGRLRVAIPVRAGYDMIRDWLVAEFGGRDIPVETPLGTLTLRVRDIFLYPSHPALALAVTFEASLPGLLPDTTGHVTFSARPVLSPDGSRVALTELRFARDLDSTLWSLATLLFEGRIRAWLEGIAVYDLRGVMDGALAALRARAADPALTGGLRVTLTRPSLRLEQLVAENDALTILGSAEAGVEAEITSLPLP
ncbi:DUF4403 family protein [Pseudoroseomonas cervicalis]|uniref:DUF4403 family protein n=1 Tax=Teichococcus cervicalis TaxID=204525 RepID=UPI002784DC89|nr:DUF4403 family protein [Pseudoroseomonas cervicalis]MDQ1077769.1 hypothetical protein [Pseudoroseomonas cervicalis]